MDQDIEDTYQALFRSCIKKCKASCLRCSYSGVNGIPSCANQDLLWQARMDWNFRGYITSGCDIATIYEYQNYTKTPEDPVAHALKARTYIICGAYVLHHMMVTIEQDKVSEEDIDRALLNLFYLQLRVRLFVEKGANNRFGGIGPRAICISEHRIMALEAAMHRIVLLKKEKNLRSLDKHFIASPTFIDPLANSSNLGGSYTGVPCNPKIILEELKELMLNIFHTVGYQNVSCNSSTYIAEELSFVKEADYVLVTASGIYLEKMEVCDRYNPFLPGYHMELVWA